MATTQTTGYTILCLNNHGEPVKGNSL